MKKLELKHIVGYLPYGLKMHFIYGNEYHIEELTGLGKDVMIIEGESEWISESEFKPILRPLSELTKKIEVNGEKFVPIIELVKIIANIHNNDMDDKFIISDTGRFLIKTPWNLRVEMFYKTKTICWAVYDTWNHKEKRTINQSLAIEKLYEWHFDLHSLIGKGLAIDLNTLK